MERFMEVILFNKPRLHIVTDFTHSIGSGALAPPKALLALQFPLLPQGKVKVSFQKIVFHMQVL
jgi:hypothetical protein